VPLVRALLDAQLVASTSEARRLIAQGAVKVDGERVSDPKAELAPGTHLVQVGSFGQPGSRSADVRELLQRSRGTSASGLTRPRHGATAGLRKSLFEVSENSF
jgi:ribosomal protein S4